ncbi:MAG: hypothetical protein ABI761_20230 [Saprospiraceae bacterium]
MQIDRIYINTHRYDQYLPSCISSIRYWYPDFPVFLIFDYSNGSPDTLKMLQKWNIQLADFPPKNYGWGLGKFEPLLQKKKEKFLVLDGDTVITGPILDKLNLIDADFIVDKEVQSLDDVVRLYYDPAKLKEWNREFNYPGYTFNTGQWVGTSGLIDPSVLDELVVWNEKPVLKYPDIFKQADQGILNYILQMLQADNKISLSRIEMMLWPGHGNENERVNHNIKIKGGDTSYVIHWAGIKYHDIPKFPYSEVHAFYKALINKQLSPINLIKHEAIGIKHRLVKKVKHLMNKIIWFFAV